MRILIDLQAAQTEASGRRGVGRYSVALAQAMARRVGDAEIWLALSGRYAAQADQIRGTFDGLIPPERIRLFDVPAHASHVPEGNAWRRRTGELLREAFLAELKPDFVHVGSLFEGLVEDAVTSVNRLVHPFPTGVTLYDLIPLLNPDAYLERKFVRDWYFEKLASLKRADVLFAISESSRREALDHLSLPARRVVNISCAVDDVFRMREIAPDEARTLKTRYGIHHKFVMYTGGIDFRKNIEGLIRAWAILAQQRRPTHQLAIVCSIQKEDRLRLASLVAELGLKADDVIFTGFVPEVDLVSLYNLCDLFVFPSLHEGFGLPALEAMACGAPTIGANNSSIVEVVGLPEAMFNARRPDSIARKMTDALDDAGLREALRANAVRQARRFSWQTCAERALEAIGQVVAERRSGPPATGRPSARKPVLAFVSPMPPLETGIADYSAELLPELGRYYEIELVTDQSEISDAWAEANFARISLADFRHQTRRFDRVLYQFGNSDFHSHMFDLLHERPGVVVLHDLYLSGVQAWREHHHKVHRHFSRALVRSHGYPALIAHLENEPDAAIWTYPVNQDVLEAAAGIIVHSAFNARRLRESCVDADALACIPHLRALAHPDRAAARALLGVADHEMLLCSFGSVGRNKNSLRLLEAFADFRRASPIDAKLVFVGQGGDGGYGAAFDKVLDDSGLTDTVAVTGYVDQATYRRYLAAADLAIQLRAFTRGETSGAVLDCLANGIPTIVNAHGPTAEIDANAVVRLSEEPAVPEIAASLRRVAECGAERARLAEAAVRLIREEHAPHRVGELYRDAIERFSATGSLSRCDQVIALAVQDRSFSLASPTDLAELSRCLDLNLPPRRPNLLFVDVSELVVRDWQSGIQRVVKSILSELLRHPPSGLRVEPVYAHVGETGVTYRSARRFTAAFVGQADDQWDDEVIEPSNGDVFLGLDLVPMLVSRMVDASVYATWRARGVKLHFVVYDLIPVLRPEFFAPGAADDFSRWIRSIAQVADGVACISQAVAREFMRFLATASIPAREGLTVGWFHLGSEITQTAAPSEASSEAARVRPELADRPFVLMVGTLEPRKGHIQIIDAFETLWDRGDDTALVIVGRRGWLADELIARIEAHPGLDRRLFWYADIDDVALEAYYRRSAGLIAASFAEGYGLPLVEAAKRGLPIFARDIPVFREVAGAHATYFDETGSALVQELGAWLGGLRDDTAVRSADIPLLTWAESAAQLLAVIFGDRSDSRAFPLRRQDPEALIQAAP